MQPLNRNWLIRLNPIQQANMGFLILVVFGLGMLVQWAWASATWFSGLPALVFVATGLIGRRVLR